MCSRHADDDFKDEVKPSTNLEITKRSCKCGSGKIVFSHKLYGSFCRECFLTRMSHKMRSEFGRRRVVSDDEAVLLAFSAGLKSSALLTLVLEGKSKRSQKKLRFQPQLVCLLPPHHRHHSLSSSSSLFVIRHDDCDGRGDSDGDNSNNHNPDNNNNQKDDIKETNNKNKNDNNQNGTDNYNNKKTDNDNDNNNTKACVRLITQQLISSNLPFKLYSHNQIYSGNDERPTPLLSNEDLKGGGGVDGGGHDDDDDEIVLEKMVKLVEERMSKMDEKGEGVDGGRGDGGVGEWCKDKTSRGMMEKLLMRDFLVGVSRVMGIGSVLVGDCVDDVAVRLISDVCQGRGGQVGYEMEFVDGRHGDVILLKPMRSFLREELQVLLRISGRAYIHQPHQEQQRGSIDQLTQQFVEKLQQDNINTLSIVCRTGEKLASTGKSMGVNGAGGNDDDDEDEDDDEEEEITCCLCKSPMKMDTIPQPSLDPPNNLTNDKDDDNKIRGNINNNDNNNNNNNNNKLKGNINNDDNTKIKGSNNNNIENRNGKCNSGGDGGGCREDDEVGEENSGGDGCCGSGGCGKTTDKRDEMSKEVVMECCCYACKILLQHMNDLSVLPANINQLVQRSMRRKRMKDCIQQYMYEEDIT